MPLPVAARNKYRLADGGGLKDDNPIADDEVRITQQGKARSYIG